MALSTYAELCTSIAAGVNRTDLTSKIPDFVLLAEGQINRHLRHRLMRSRTTATVDAQLETVPTDFAGPISMRLTSGTERNLEWIDPGMLMDLGGYYDKSSGEPEKYSVVGSTFWYSPDPDGTSYTVEIIYNAKVPALATNSTNWLLSLYPDIYYHGSMAEAWLYLLDEQRAAGHQGVFMSAIEAANRAAVMENQAGYLHVGNPFAP